MKTEQKNLLEKIWRKYAKKLIKHEEDKLNIGAKRKKLNPESSNFAGLDRVKISIPKSNIRKLEGCRYSIDYLNISDPLFSKLKSGEVQGNYYCHLDVNLPKLLTGDNIANVRTKEHLLEALGKLEERLGNFYRLKINLKESFFISLEVNKNFSLSRDFTKYQGAMFICAFEIIKKKFKPMTPFIEPFSGIRGGKKNKKVRVYDKTYERVCAELGELEWFQQLSKSEITEVARSYQSEARIEFYLHRDALWNLIPKEITLGDFSEGIEDYLDTTYEILLQQLGLDGESFEKRKSIKAKRLKHSYKQQKNMNEGHPLNKFLANEREIWGFAQVAEIIDDLTPNKSTARVTKWRAKKHFERIGSRFGISQENWKELHEFIENL